MVSKFGDSVKNVGILMIATNAYLERWKETARDLERNAFNSMSKVVIHLFTNEIEAATAFVAADIKRIKVEIHQIPGWGWPEATLLRYEFFSQNQSRLNEDFLVYLDSDMRVTGDIEMIIPKLSKFDGIGVVSHPGFFRPRGIDRFKFYVLSPLSLIKDAKTAALSSRNLGAWENNPVSKAFVKRNNRKTYVHGAIWFGYRDEFISMCESLSARIRKDLEIDFIAKWHDESHLNWYISKHPHKIFDNRLSWVQGYKNLRVFDINYLVSNVQKETGEGRAPSNV
jgi:hypothetical protein